jgi:hypothetical protein
MGLPGKGSAVSRLEQARPINEGHEGVARLVAASRRSMGGEHAWVNLDIGIAYVLGRTDRQMIRPDRLRAAGIGCSLPKICDGKHQPDERRLFRPLIRKPLMPQAAQSSGRNNRKVGTIGDRAALHVGRPRPPGARDCCSLHRQLGR